MTDIWTVEKLSKGDLELAILPGIGGRLWDIVFGGRSLLFQNPDLAGRSVNLAALADLPTRSPQFGFPLWGGEKTWISPDTHWVNAAPYPTLDSAPYTVVRRTDCQIEMQSAVCPLSGLCVTRLIALEGASGFSIRHTVTNRGEHARTAGIWSVMMLRRPATLRLDETEGAVKAIFGPPIHFVRRDGAAIETVCDKAGEFKIGLYSTSGRTELRIGPPENQVWLDCIAPPAEAADRYAHGHNVEVFNSGDYSYCEAEWHAPVSRLMPGHAMTFTQEFRLAAIPASDR